MSWGSAQEPAAPGGPLRLPGWAWWHLALGEWWLCHPGPPLYSVSPSRTWVWPASSPGRAGIVGTGSCHPALLALPGTRWP